MLKSTKTCVCICPAEQTCSFSNEVNNLHVSLACDACAKHLTDNKRKSNQRTRYYQQLTFGTRKAEYAQILEVILD